jgi:hypothetical protein
VRSSCIQLGNLGQRRCLHAKSFFFAAVLHESEQTHKGLPRNVRATGISDKGDSTCRDASQVVVGIAGLFTFRSGNGTPLEVGATSG